MKQDVKVTKRATHKSRATRVMFFQLEGVRMCGDEACVAKPQQDVKQGREKADA